ncbi:hypothetical protein PSMK_09550 [Phycisphaera mikurensis NBRC 102666]|uniref:PEP-CTERM protein-sorting domain-containing protein n=2 Tax=Phycisphaera TaxID=666508 RepID=I0ICX6_PHYMF|nr:hypothetical protein PSMK_09550 [Phycisphaera mikurensis NBRC 102666]
MGGGAFAQAAITAQGNVRVDQNAVSGSLSNPLSAAGVGVGDPNGSNAAASGSLSLAGGASATVQQTFLANFFGSRTGVLDVRGFGTAYGGGDLAAGGGDGRGVLRVLDGGLVDLDGRIDLGSFQGGGSGILQIDGFAEVEATSAGFLRGRGDVTGGGVLDLGFGGLTLGDGGSFDLSLDTGGELRVGTLQVGSTNGGVGSTLRLGDDAVARLGAGQVNAGSRVEMAGGTIRTDFLLLSGGALEGSGRFEGELRVLDGAGSRGRVSVAAGERLAVQRPGQFITAIDNAGLVENGGVLDLGGATFVNNQSGSYLGRGGTFRGFEFQNEGQDAAVDLLSGANTFDADFINSQNRRVTVTGGATAAFQQDVVNQGLVRVDPGSQATFVGTYSGAGDLLGGGGVTFLGDVQIGNSPAVVNVGVASTFASTSTFEIEIGGTDRDAEDFDGVNFLTGGSYDFQGGTLDVKTFGGFAPENGDTFEIFRFESFAMIPVTGGFGDVVLQQLGGGLSFDVSNLLVDGTITVVPEPASAALLLAGTGLLLRRRRA